MSDQPTKANKNAGGQLFQNMDEQERTFAPEQLPDADLPPGEMDQGGTAASGTAISGDLDTTPAAVPVGTGGSSVPAAPPSETFDPGMERERRDLEQGETGVFGPDTRDENVKPAGSVTQERNRRS